MDTINKEVILHVGLPKTGTTFLQLDVFKLSKYYMDVHENNPLREFLNKIVATNNICLNMDIERKIIHDYLMKLEQDKVFISDESLSGDPFTNYMNLEIILESLSKLNINTKIILVTRKQDSIIESLYFQSIHEGYFKSFNKFSNFANGSFLHSKPVNIYGINLNINSFNYYKMYEVYNKYFTKENILVLPYEELKENQSSFLNKLKKFTGIEDLHVPKKSKKRNISYSSMSVRLALVLNRFLWNERNGCKIIYERPFFNYLNRKKTNNRVFSILASISYRMALKWFFNNTVDKLFHDKATIDKDLKLEIMKIHKQDNKKLDQLLSLDLKKYKYY